MSYNPNVYVGSESGSGERTPGSPRFLTYTFRVTGSREVRPRDWCVPQDAQVTACIDCRRCTDSSSFGGDSVASLEACIE